MSSLPPPPRRGPYMPAPGQGPHQPHRPPWHESTWKLAGAIVGGLFLLALFVGIGASGDRDRPTQAPPADQDDELAADDPADQDDTDEGLDDADDEDEGGQGTDEAPPEASGRATLKTAFAGAIESNRNAIADDIERDVIPIETVDLFEFNPDADTLTMSASSDFSTEQYHHDGAWSAARYLAGLYRNLDEYQPILDLRVEDVRYVCPGHVMREL